MEHEREKQFVQTQQEIALRNAGREGTDIQMYGNSHLGQTASVGAIKVLAELGSNWMACGADFVVPIAQISKSWFSSQASFTHNGHRYTISKQLIELQNSRSYSWMLPDDADAGKVMARMAELMEFHKKLGGEIRINPSSSQTGGRVTWENGTLVIHHSKEVYDFGMLGAKLEELIHVKQIYDAIGDYKKRFGGKMPSDSIVKQWIGVHRVRLENEAAAMCRAYGFQRVTIGK